MANLLLIHGAWHGGWCWHEVVPLLQAEGHQVWAPDLPGHGENSLPLAQVSLERYVDAVCELIETIGQPVILLGHSMGGVVISQVAERLPSKIERLVYLAAVLPLNGESLIDNALERRAVELVQAADDGLSLTVQDENLARFFYQDCLPVLPWAKAKLVPQALTAFVTPVALTEAGFGRVPRSYIHCRNDLVMEFGNQRRMVRATPCVSTFILECGHMAMFADPQGVANCLLQIIQEQAALVQK